jgi:hypothetical protein
LQETQEALRELSKFFTENTLRNRRNLRGEIERQSLNNHLEFLAKFEKVKVSLLLLFLLGGIAALTERVGL